MNTKWACKILQTKSEWIQCKSTGIQMQHCHAMASKLQTRTCLAGFVYSLVGLDEDGHALSLQADGFLIFKAEPIRYGVAVIFLRCSVHCDLKWCCIKRCRNLQLQSKKHVTKKFVVQTGPKKNSKLFYRNTNMLLTAVLKQYTMNKANIGLG